MTPRIEVAAIDCLSLCLFESIEESNVPWLLAACARIRASFGPALIDLVPAYTSLMVHYDLAQLSGTQAHERLLHALDDLSPAPDDAGAFHELPVWYDAQVGPELPLIAARSGLSPAQVIEAHCARAYRVFALGFAPGFAYMGLVDAQLATPRLESPRQRVAAGSVGIADRQTAAYPTASPGGWNLLGRTPQRLFDRARDGFCLLQPGDRVRFVPIDRERFLQLGGDPTPQPAASEVPR